MRSTSIYLRKAIIPDESHSTQSTPTSPTKLPAHTFKMSDAEIAIIVGVFAILIAVLLMLLLVWKPNMLEELKEKFERWKEEWKR